MTQLLITQTRSRYRAADQRGSADIGCPTGRDEPKMEKVTGPTRRTHRKQVTVGVLLARRGASAV